MPVNRLGALGGGFECHFDLGIGWKFLKLGVNWNVFGGVDSESDPVTADFENDDFNIVGDHYLLVFLPTNNQHALPHILKTPAQAKKYE